MKATSVRPLVAIRYKHNTINPNRRMSTLSGSISLVLLFLTMQVIGTQEGFDWFWQAEGESKGNKDEIKKSRLTLRWTNYFLETFGHSTLKRCPKNQPIKDCLKLLDNHNHAIFLAFTLDCSSLCHYIQSEKFNIETQHFINNLKVFVHHTNQKLISLRKQLEK